MAIFALYTQLLTPKIALMNDIFEFEPSYRKAPLTHFMSYLNNPGKFSILLLGKRGVGKTYWAQLLAKQKNKKITTVNCLAISDADVKDWGEIFIKADEGYLLIEDIEELSKKSQAILFEYISTYNGKFGWEEKKFNIRLIFSTSLKIESIRDSENRIIHKLFDRISQFVVHLPSFQEANSHVWNDFTNVWKNLKFSNENLPKENLIFWIENNSHRFYGNFRDLEKIAINWHELQLRKLDQVEILKIISADFYHLYAYPEQRIERYNLFEVNDELDFYSDILPNFRRFIKELAKRKYGKLYLAPQKKPLGVPYRTMDRW